MKTFKMFLTEEDKKKEIIFEQFKTFLPMCDHYIQKEISNLKSGRFFIRAMHLISGNEEFDEDNIKMIGVQKTVENRIPRDTALWVHRRIGAYFKSKFNLNYRSDHIAFCQQSDTDLNLFEKEIYFIMPVGANYKYCFSPKVSDLTFTIDPTTGGTDTRKLIQKFLKNNSMKYFKKNLDQKTVELASVCFSDLYWTARDAKMHYLSLDYSLEQFADVISRDHYYLSSYSEDVLYMVNDEVKDGKSFTETVLEKLNLKTLDDFRTVMFRIGQDLMDSFGYIETVDQSELKPYRNEVMIHCKEYVAVHRKMKRYLMEYLNENF